MLFEEISDINYLINNMNDQMTNIVDDKTGLARGNMFNNEYKPYKNYKYDAIRTNNEKDNLLLKIDETYFALMDLGLYLDLHSNDLDVYERFQNCLSNFENLKEEYEKKFGPLELTCVKGYEYDWISNPWPWDNDGGNMYV